jgi:hypothetical protein
MNSEEYLNYLQESQHIAHDSYDYLNRMYENYIFDLQSEDFLKQQRDEKIEEILK